MQVDKESLKRHFKELSSLHKEFKKNNLMSKEIDVQQIFE